MKPRDAGFYANRGNTHCWRDNFELAIKDYTKAIDLEPSYGPSYIRLGNVLDQQGDLDRAIQYYNKAIELDPDHPIAYRNRAGTYTKKGEVDKAIADYTKVIGLHPLIKDTYYFLGEVYMQIGNWSEAKLNLTVARTLEVDVIRLFHKKYGSVTNFEQKTGIQVPADIVPLLTPP